MFWIYLASAIFGGAFLIPMILGGLDTDTDVEFDTDTDFDTDFDTEVDADLDGSSHGVSGGLDAADAIVGSLLSFRSMVFFATFFGAAGLLFGALGYSLVVTFLTSVLLGVVAAGANSVIFGLLKSSEVSSHLPAAGFEGRRGSVTVPIEAGRRGRIRVEIGEQPQYLVAESYDGHHSYEAGHPVVVVELDQGIARVASLIELEGGSDG
jgi:membrane protein implicated in regulation of membrane protease activity